MEPIIAEPRLYLRRKDGTASEPINAATFHQIARQIHDITMELDRLHIANVEKSERWSRRIIYESVQDASHSLHLIQERLRQVQDNPAPYVCKWCHGKRPNCEHCDGTGLVQEPQR